MRIFRFMIFISKVRNTVATVKQDADRASKFIRYGIMSIIMSVFAVAFGVLTAIVMPLAFGSESLIGTIFLVLALASCFIATLLFLVYSLIYLIAQLKINKKAMSWIAFVIFFAAIAAIVVTLILLL